MGPYFKALGFQFVFLMFVSAVSANKSKLDESVTCSMCQAKEVIIKGKCDHSYCEKCVIFNTPFKKKFVCPLCFEKYGCVICMVRIRDTKVNCGHMFCRSCILDKKKREDNDCPICRKTIYDEDEKSIDHIEPSDLALDLYGRIFEE